MSGYSNRWVDTGIWTLVPSSIGSSGSALLRLLSLRPDSDLCPELCLRGDLMRSSCLSFRSWREVALGWVSAKVLMGIWYLLEMLKADSSWYRSCVGPCWDVTDPWEVPTEISTAFSWSPSTPAFSVMVTGLGMLSSPLFDNELFGLAFGLVGNFTGGNTITRPGSATFPAFLSFKNGYRASGWGGGGRIFSGVLCSDLSSSLFPSRSFLMFLSLRVKSDGSSSEDEVEVIALGFLFSRSKDGGTLLLAGSLDVS